MGWLAVLQMIPTIIDIIKKIEEAIPQGGQGDAKKGIVLDILKTVIGNIEKNLPMITQIIGIIVSAFNKTGTFKTAETEVK